MTPFRLFYGISLIVLVSIKSEGCAYGSTFLLESPRSLGRGGARVAAFDSDEATRINPATLAEPKVNFQLRWFELDIMVGKNTIDTITDIIDTLSNPKGIKSLESFGEKFGQTQYGRGQLSLFSMRFGAFEMSPFVSNEAFLNLDSPVLPEISWLNDTVAGLNLSYSMQLANNLFVGTTLRPLYRLYIAGTMSADQVMDLASQKITFNDISPLKTGTGFGMDLGFIYNLPANQRLGLTFHNLGDSTLSGSEDKTPPKIRQKTSLGYLMRSELWGFDWDWMLDYQDIENRDGINVLRLIHSGLEIGTSYFTRDHDFGVTFGLNEGYFTSGIFADLYLIRLDVHHYTAETGFGVGQSKDDRWAFTARSSMTF